MVKLTASAINLGVSITLWIGFFIAFASTHGMGGVALAILISNSAAGTGFGFAVFMKYLMVSIRQKRKILKLTYFCDEGNYTKGPEKLKAKLLESVKEDFPPNVIVLVEAEGQEPYIIDTRAEENPE